MSANLLPIRLLGFGFYWAWLFLVCVSPSLILGPQQILDLPLESVELALRIVFIILIIVAARFISTRSMSRLLLAISMLAGAGASVIATADAMDVGMIALILMACADAATFMLWLCFFGNRKVGEIAVYMALSYAVGAALCLVISMLEFQMAQLCSILLPILSGISFYLSYQHYVVDGDTNGIDVIGAVNPVSSSDTGESSSTEPRASVEETMDTFPYMRKLVVSLGLYAMMFSLITSVAFCNGIAVDVQGPAIEAPCALVIGIVLAGLFVYSKNVDAIYFAYRIVPLIMGLGIASLLIGDPIAVIISSFLIMTAYLLFEIMALNDICNAVKIRGLNAIRILGVARLGISCGMFTGWALGILSSYVSDVLPPIVFTALVDIPALIVASTLIFTEKEIFAVRAVTDERLVLEREEQDARRHDAQILQEASDIEEALIIEFGEQWKMSKREMEVLPLLLKGKTTAYISEQLFIAPGTTKTHIYNIYQKLDIHTKMELFDMFDSFRQKR